MSIVISASSAKIPSLITGEAAAVVDVFSVLSIVNLVLKTLEPLSLISTVNILPLVCAVLKLALTDVNVIAYGILNVILAVPAVNAVVSSLQAIVRYSVFAVALVDKPSDVGLVTNLQVIPDPDKGGNLLKWEFNYKMNANTIDIYRSTSYDGPYQLITALNPKAKEYFDSREIQPAVAYYYYISINNGIGQSLPSARVPAILEGNKPNMVAPQDLTISRQGNIVTLKFRKLGYDSKSYYVYRADGYVAPLKQLPRMLISTDSLLTYTDTFPKHNRHLPLNIL